jgi:hypothetical protein
MGKGKRLSFRVKKIEVMEWSRWSEPKPFSGHVYEEGLVVDIFLFSINR